MKRSLPWSGRTRLLAGVLILLASRAPGAVMEEYEDPQWLKLRTAEASLGFELEGLREKSDLQGASATHEYLSLTPLVGLHLGGSIYHPNLMIFDVSGEGGYGWIEDNVTGTGTDTRRNESRELLRYLAQVNFLAGKPLNGSFVASQDHTFQDYNFFGSATVDTMRYEGRLSYQLSPVTLTLNAGYRDEESRGLNDATRFNDTYVHFNGLHERAAGLTTLTGGVDLYENQVNSEPWQNSLTYTIGLADSETFGHRKQIVASTGASLSQYEYFNQETETIHATENITVNHLPNLDSFYNFAYDYSRQDPVETTVLQGVGGLRHRLYESLTSTLDLHGTYDDSSGLGVSASNARYGAGVREDYTKRLCSWARLSLGAGIVADHEDHEASGSILTVIRESHTLHLPGPNYRPALLNNPRVIAATIQVFSPQGILADPNTDYYAIPRGELIEIQLIPLSPLLKDGDTVTVNYDSVSLYNAAYEAINGSAQVRLDLFDRFGAYGRVNWLDNNAPPEVLTETLVDLVGGVDANWRWFRGGAEYEDFDSNFTKYKSWRFYENFTWPVADSSHLGLDLSQSFYRYPDNRRQTQYQFIGRFATQINTWLWWNVEGGHYLQDAFSGEQSMYTARTDCTGTWGKLSLKAGYQYNNQLTSQVVDTERRDRHFVYIHLRRRF